MILSIIIPMYNIEKYIEKCIYSCINQDIPQTQYEIVVVNDGSVDGGAEIVRQISQVANNVRMISKPNGGLSSARNMGIKHAKGRYIWFVDGDDFIEENCLGRIISLLSHDLDILQLQYRLVYEDKRLLEDAQLYSIDGIKTGLEIFEQGGLPAPAPFSIFSTSFLKKYRLEFVEGIYHEDSEFKPRAVYFAEKIASDSEVSYNYLQRLSGSITSHYKLKNALDMLKVANSLLYFIKVKKVPKKYHRYFYREISISLNTTFFWIYQLSADDKKTFVDCLCNNKHLFDSMIKSEIIKYQLEGWILKISPKLGVSLIETLYNKTRE